MRRTQIAIVGAGMGGLTAAACLLRVGVDVRVYEQAARFTRLGAGIQLGPNAMKALRPLGLGERLEAVAFRPPYLQNRDAITGAPTYRFELLAREQAFGAPYLLLHRGDLHSALLTLVPAEVISLDHKLVAVYPGSDGVELVFADGSRAIADGLIAADGVHSRVRELMLGVEQPRFTGRVAYRAVFPVDLLPTSELDPSCKWWGPDRHIVIYYVSAGREIYFVTSVPEPDWDHESWSMTGDVRELRMAFEAFHPTVRGVLDACPAVHKWAIYERDPLPSWTQDGVALLGDACHPMTPYMAQGAATAMEDAVVLARCLEAGDDLQAALGRYERSRRERTSRIQQESSQNTWLHYGGETDWVYGYDPWTTSLDDAALTRTQ
jgi:6-hydroxynicotinate 3-monooxygenase